MSDPTSPTTTLTNSEKHSSSGPKDFVIDIDSRTTTAVNTVTDQHVASALAEQAEIWKNHTEKLEDYPSGYPLTAAFLSSEPSFSIYRGYNYLYSRVLLELQDEIRLLEKQLVNLDKKHAQENENRLTSRRIDLREAKKHPRQDGGMERAELIEAIRVKLINYGEVLLQARDMTALQRPSKRDYRSFRTWFSNEKPLVELESQYIKRKEDLVTIRQGREWAGFDGWIEDVIRKIHPYCPFVHKMFATPELREKTHNKHVFYYSSSRIEKLVGMIITLVIFILLVLPVVAMYRLTSVVDRNSTFDAVGILVVFTLLFSAAMSLLTKAKRHELFAASAAYCAVLVVFISNFGGPNAQSPKPNNAH
ncbi:hypothetical protein BDV96DRAFT_579200 [Lophiotrema nucula]|uniref:DUF6594 domain-containing protein n=1 Tax=Lophiotrema nucula TaxID=690887 RepID=A0A6A5Z4Y8_9PLEO|nr:hypothetical protein BDV96DRAFT_579200 [Lophiotrema nucula]